MRFLHDWTPFSRAGLKYSLKFGLVGVGSYLVAEGIGLRFPYLAVISAIVVMQVYVVDVVEMARFRLLGTLIGAVLGLIVLFLNPGGTFATALGLFAAMVLCGVMVHYRPKLSIAAITVASVVLVGTYQGSKYTYALDRVVEIVIGVVLALLVSVLIWPQRALDRLTSAVADFYSQAGLALDDLMDAFLNGQTCVIEEKLLPVDQAANLSRTLWAKGLGNENLFSRYQSDFLEDAVQGMEGIRDHLHAMVRALQVDCGHPVTWIMEPELRAYQTALSQALKAVAQKGKTPLPQDAIAQAREQAAIRLAELHSLGRTHQLPLAKVTQFFTFYHALNHVADHIGRMSQEKKAG